MSHLKLDPMDLETLLRRVVPSLAFQDGQVVVCAGDLRFSLGEAELRANLDLEFAGLKIHASSVKITLEGAAIDFNLQHVLIAAH